MRVEHFSIYALEYKKRAFSGKEKAGLYVIKAFGYLGDSF